MSEWIFTSSITKPDGHRIEVTVAIPEDIATNDVLEQSEVAQMAAVRAFQIRTVTNNPNYLHGAF